MLSVVTARDVPEARARMAAWARDPGPDGAENWFTFFLGPCPDSATESRIFDRIDNVAATIARSMVAQLPAAELFYVSADMTDLARHAATTLTDYRLHPEDLPAPVGLMVYERPPVEGTANSRRDGITMVSWGPGRGGLWVHTWAPLAESWLHGGKRDWDERSPRFPTNNCSPAPPAPPDGIRSPPMTRRQTPSKPLTGFSPALYRIFSEHRSHPRSPPRTATTGVD
jgi:hypothetical protein